MISFDIPIVLFFFKREKKTLEILKRIAEIKPTKLYLISDGPRDEAEADRVVNCRKLVDDAINWDCEVIRDYAEVNMGVYNRIGLGAKWVLSKESWAIFLEDDNLPELSFFPFCREMLSMYENDTRILWICGTNYLENYSPADGSSYVFTKHMLPCGWASWANKFSRFYDGDLALLDDPYIRKRVEFENSYRPLAKQDASNWEREKERIHVGRQPNSWDYQMSFSLRVHGLYGIVPKVNQIKNIGVDLDSIHGGTSFDNIMTRRFCGLQTYSLQFPLVHPKVVLTDIMFERQLNKIITYPLKYRIQGKINLCLKWIFGINKNASLTGELRNKFKPGSSKNI